MSTLTTLIGEIDQHLEYAIEQDKQGAQPQFNVSEQELFRRYILTVTGPLKVAIPIDDLAEVSVLPPIKYLPNLPQWILGVVNLREEIVSVVDLPGLLEDNRAVRKGERVAVVKNERVKVGVVIDNIIGTVSLPESSITLTEEAESPLFSETVTMDETIYSLLTAENMLNFKKLIDYYEEH